MPPRPRQEQQQWPRGPWTPLHLAAMHGSARHVLDHLSEGVLDINHCTPEGWTPLMIASWEGHAHIAKILLDHEADFSIVGDRERTALILAAQEGHASVTRLLVEAGADAEGEKSADSVPPLRMATLQGFPEVMRVLIESGANVNRRDEHGMTYLFHAASIGHVGATKELLRAKADPLLGMHTNNTGGSISPLEVAARLGHAGVVRELVQNLGIEGCGGVSRGLDALYAATQEKKEDVMNILMDAGVDDSGVILNIAAGYGMEASVKRLIQKRLERQYRCDCGYLNYCDDDGATPLVASIESALSGSPRIVQLLIEAGADTTSEIPIASSVREGFHIFKTPLDIATYRLRDKTLRGEVATEEQLHTLKAIRQLLLRDEAVRAKSWLWPGNFAVSSCPGNVGTFASREPAKVSAVPPATSVKVLRRKSERRAVFLGALRRYASKS